MLAQYLWSRSGEILIRLIINISVVLGFFFIIGKLFNKEFFYGSIAIGVVISFSIIEIFTYKKWLRENTE
ncbi:hypothetical protein BKP45_10685 [Anaerobacillus alkalidiazotrophicus]|uniref:Uncharacterized protein n=1 Tax=Anaerobacillus alkalidiazotrophicus TaxID=472963 RepID=A0A1S2M494_9BACI|nr:hypothetical protein [Anaerobacillus alkalidiazotrophicus]OIJ18060.1 hypothetical protein BKP45_16400 [Anaerobacillus alkalidiazotrophicus]OIJ19539.1 hypothetical protein BKP45_10685 [Anaerobacillus alkalidiazotrophicus]